MACAKTVGAGYICAFWQNGASGSLNDGLGHLKNLQAHGCKNCGSDPTEPGNDVSNGQFTVNFVTKRCCAPGVIETTCYCNGTGAPDPSNPGFKPGWCTAHVVQFQRNEYGIGDRFAFDVVLFDDAKTIVGQVQKQAVDASTGSLGVTSALPWVFVITPGQKDEDPVGFKYSDQSWDSKSKEHQSSLGKGPENGYQKGNREGDMGFSC